MTIEHKDLSSLPPDHPLRRPLIIPQPGHPLRKPLIIPPSSYFKVPMDEAFIQRMTEWQQRNRLKAQEAAREKVREEEEARRKRGFFRRLLDRIRGR